MNTIDFGEYQVIEDLEAYLSQPYGESFSAKPKKDMKKLTNFLENCPTFLQELGKGQGQKDFFLNLSDSDKKKLASGLYTLARAKDGEILAQIKDKQGRIVKNLRVSEMPVETLDFLETINSLQGAMREQEKMDILLKLEQNTRRTLEHLQDGRLASAKTIEENYQKYLTHPLEQRSNSLLSLCKEVESARQPLYASLKRYLEEVEEFSQNTGGFFSKKKKISAKEMEQLATNTRICISSLLTLGKIEIYSYVQLGEGYGETIALVQKKEEQFFKTYLLEKPDQLQLLYEFSGEDYIFWKDFREKYTFLLRLSQQETGKLTERKEEIQ